jgi:hypothetical protein
MASQALKIDDPVCFALFDLSGARERKIGKSERILDLYASWERMKEENKSKTTRNSTSSFQYKIRYRVHLYLSLPEDRVEELNLIFVQVGVFE